MSEYKIQAVSTETRQYDTKFGPMISYKLKLEGHDTPVELGQKSTTPAPQEGQTLNGHIEETQYGPKFKKEQAFGGGGGGFTQSPAATSQKTGGGTQTHQGTIGDNSPFTMYLSYAKDIAVALITAGKGTIDQDKYAEALDIVLHGGKTLFEGRPDAPGSKPDGEPLPEPEPETDVNQTPIDMKSLNDLFPS